MAATNVNSVTNMYVDGIHTLSFPENIKKNSDNGKTTIIGRYADCYHFNGTIDEVAIYNRALTPSEIYNHSHIYRHNSTLRSVPITLPSAGVPSPRMKSKDRSFDDSSNNTWNTLHFSRSVPDNTYLNISVHDTATNDTLLTNTNRSDELYLDLSNIDPIAHPSIYLEAYFQSNRTETPTLYDWAVNWSAGTGEAAPPELMGDLPEVINITEDTPEENIIDLADVFHDRYSNIAPPAYGVEFVSDPANISLTLNGSQLDVTELAANWSGICSVRLNCTNVHGLTTSTPMFDIFAQPIDDAPAWNSTPPMLTAAQRITTTSEYSLNDYVTDAEDDTWEFSIISENVTATIIDNNHIEVQAVGNFTGEAYVHVKVYQSSDHSLFSNTTIPITVTESERPSVRLASPRDGTNITETDIILKWELIAHDFRLGNATFDLYFGKEEIPDKYASDLSATNYTVTDLEDETRYYWHVIPRDSIGQGSCPNGTWWFIVNTSRPLPWVEYVSPQNRSTRNTTTVELLWNVHNPLNENLKFDVYLGNSTKNVTHNTTVMENSLILEGLQDKTTYFWRIVPWNENVTGFSKSGTWHFNVETEFEKRIELRVMTGETEFNITQGTIGRFAFNVTNLGNDVETVHLGFIKWLLEGVALNVSELTLSPGERGRFQLMISVGDSTVVSDYKIEITATVNPTADKPYVVTYPITVNVLAKDDHVDVEESPDDGGLMYLLESYWEVPLVIISAVIAIFGYFQFRKKKNMFQNLRREIDSIYGNLSDVKEAIDSLEKISSKLTEYMDREKITDNQYIILDRKINDHVMQLRGSARIGDLKEAVRFLPPAIRNKVEKILEDGKLTKDEFESLENVLWEEEISEEERARIGNFAVQWLREDTGEVVEWGSDRETGQDEIVADIEHVPSKAGFGSSFADIVRGQVPPPMPPVPPGSTMLPPGVGPGVDVSAPVQPVTTAYTMRGRASGVPMETVRPSPEGPAVQVPTESPAIPPAPGVTIPHILPVPDETKALPEGSPGAPPSPPSGNVLSMISDIIEKKDAREAGDGISEAPVPPPVPPLPEMRDVPALPEAPGTSPSPETGGVVDENGNAAPPPPLS